jgi:2-aminoadipate transaminase
MDYRFSQTIDSLKSSAVREILKLTQGNSIISFAGGLPAEDFFPIAEMKEAFARAFDQGAKALQYGLTDGYIPLREQVAARLAKKNINVGVDNMILTTGSQQAIDVLARVYVDQGDVILVENPTYLAALQLFQSRGVQVIPVNGDVDGMNLDDLAEKVKKYNPKLVYVVPTFANPTGKVWSVERRLGLLQICRENNVLIFEDDPYGELRYDDGDLFPSIFSLDDHPNGSAVIYTSTFSKTVAPALRTGWAVGDTNVIQLMTRAKQAVDLHSSSIDQQALYQLLLHFDLDAHIVKIRDEYKKRMNVMNDLLVKQAWSNITWNAPKGGMFLWVELPENVDAEELLKYAVKEGVAFVPGKPFYAQEPKVNTLRLNFTHTDPENTAVGVNRFTQAVNNYFQTV